MKSLITMLANSADLDTTAPQEHSNPGLQFVFRDFFLNSEYHHGN